MQKLLWNRKPYEDELLYSWVMRLAKLNGLSPMTLMSSYMGVDRARVGELPVDVRNGFLNLYSYIIPDRGLKDLYLDTTTFGFESIAMTPGQQTRCINNVFRPSDKLNTPVNALFQTVKICPECLRKDKEKYGEAYLHRSHQLSGVCTCHRHGTVLMEYVGKKGHECEFNMDDYRNIAMPASVESVKEYTAYAQALFESGMQTDIYRIKQAVFAKLRSLGYTAADNYRGLTDDIERSIFPDMFQNIDIPKLLKIKMITPKNIQMQELVPFLRYLYPSVTNLAEAAGRKEPLLEEYTCRKCGHIYCSTPSAKKDGWGCPYCESRMPENERFTKLVKTVGKGEYEPVSEFEGLDTPVDMKHKVCGRTTKIKPRGFLFENVRCTCANRITEDEAREAIEAHEGFKLIKFINTNEPVTIYHEKCGREFTCDYRKFLSFPGCRACNPPHMYNDTFSERVKELVGDEYTVVGEFVDQDTKVRMRHNICGTEYECKPSHFLDGTSRCPGCRTILSHTDLERMLHDYSDGRYVITEYGKNNCTIKDMQTGRVIEMTPQKIAQEIRRVTPSNILPVEKRPAVVKEPADVWERGFDYLQQYIAEHGDSNIPKRDTYKGYNLGLWCQKQREAYKMGRLKPQRKEKLEDVGFTLDPLEAEWNRRYEQYQRYAAGNGAYIPRRRDFEGEHLGAWVESQRKMYAAGKLSDERKMKLLAVNPELFGENAEK